jgi:hypothetical protein
MKRSSQAIGRKTFQGNAVIGCRIRDLRPTVQKDATTWPERIGGPMRMGRFVAALAFRVSVLARSLAAMTVHPAP